MTDRPSTRRAFLAAAGSALSLAGCLGDGDGLTGSDDATPRSSASTATPATMGNATPADDAHVGDQRIGAWHQVTSPVSGTLYAVETTRHGVYAVGEDGVILNRCNGVWEVVDQLELEVTGNALLDAAVSGDGHTLWFAGSSGAIGAYEPSTQTLLDYSAPDEKTSTWEAIGVAGTKRNEEIFVANGSGELARGVRDGEKINWKDVHEPGGGSSFSAIEFVDGTGFLTDTSAEVYRTTDKGDSWNNIGIRGGTSDLMSIGAAGGNSLHVGASGGTIYRYNGMTWTQLQAGDGAGVTGLSIENRRSGLACTSEGDVYALRDGQWKKQGQPTDGGFQSIVHATETSPQVAVGGGGAIAEHFPQKVDL